MIKSPRFLTSPSVHVTSPTSCNAKADAPCDTLFDGSTQAPTQSPIDTATRWASEVVSHRPRMTGYLALTKISAARSIPSSNEAGFPSIKQAGACSLP